MKLYSKNVCNSALAFIVVSIFAICYGIWFANMQVNAVMPHGGTAYPKEYFILTVFKCFLTVIVFFSFSQLMLSYISRNKINTLLTAMSYLPLVLVLFHVQPLVIISLILLFQLFILARTLTRSDYERLFSLYLTDLIVLCVYFLCHLVLTTRFSPLYWQDAILAAEGSNSEEIPVVTPIFRGYLLVKQYAFSYFDPAQWGGVMNPPINFSSTLMQLIAYIFDFPSVSYQSYHVLIMAIFFVLMILGSFGFYLFLKYAANLHSIFAFFGGFLFTFSGSPILVDSFITDGGIFFSPLIVIPYALLMISLAYKKDDYRYAAIAGIALAAQFFFFTPHPEGTIYSVLFYGIYTLGLIIFSSRLNFIRRFSLAALSFFTFLLLSAYVLAPILIDTLNHNMYAFAHTGDIAANSLTYVKTYTRVLLIFAPLSFLFMFFNKKITSIYLSSLCLALFIYLLIGVTSSVPLSTYLIHRLHLGIHFWIYPRIAVYYYASVFVIAMFGLEAITDAIFNLYTKIYGLTTNDAK